MITTTSLLKSVGPMPLMSTQYLSTATLVKPVVVVSTPSTLPPHTNNSSWGVHVICLLPAGWGSQYSVIVSVWLNYNSSSTNVVLSALVRGHRGTAQIKNLRQKFWLSVPTPYSSMFKPFRVFCRTYRSHYQWWTCVYILDSWTRIILFPFCILCSNVCVCMWVKHRSGVVYSTVVWLYMCACVGQDSTIIK
jgi:hypothetical protein